MGNKIVKCYHCKQELVSGEERIQCETCKRVYHVECVGMHSQLVKDDIMCLYCKKNTNMQTVFT